MRTISIEEWRRKLRCGYAGTGSGEFGIPKERRGILALDKETGATCIEPVRVIGLDAPARNVRRIGGA